MKSYKASLRRLAELLAAFGLVTVLTCAQGPLLDRAFTLVIASVGLLAFAALFVARRPSLDLDGDGIRMNSIWSSQFVGWPEIRSIEAVGWGPLRYVSVAKARGWPVRIPQWFEPPADQLKLEILAFWKDQGSNREQLI